MPFSQSPSTSEKNAIEDVLFDQKQLFNSLAEIYQNIYESMNVAYQNGLNYVPPDIKQVVTLAYDIEHDNPDLYVADKYLYELNKSVRLLERVMEEKGLIPDDEDSTVHWYFASGEGTIGFASRTYEIILMNWECLMEEPVTYIILRNLAMLYVYGQKC